jgi:hypothetical protein
MQIMPGTGRELGVADPSRLFDPATNIRAGVRYMKGLVVQELCMTCHGTSETIPAAVKAKLQQEYPNDKATGYLPNQFRGGVSIKQLL